MKKFVSGMLAGAVLAGTVAFGAQYVADTATFKVLVNGKEFNSDKPIVAIEGSTYLPLKAIGEALGVPVQWNEELKQVEVGSEKSSDVSAVSGYTFENLSVEEVQGVVSISLDVTNNTGKDLDGLIVNMEFYNEAGESLGKISGAVSNTLKNGETKTVKAKTSNNSIMGYSEVKYQVK